MTQKRTKLKAKSPYGGWFRMYNDLLDDPQIQLLSDKQFKIWINLLCIASKRRGVLPSANDLAFRLRLDVEATQLVIEQLLSAGLLDLNMKTREITPHNWQDRQPNLDSSRDRMRKLRAKNKKIKSSKTGGDVTGDEQVTSCDGDVPKSTSTSTSNNNRKVYTGIKVSDSATSKGNDTIGSSICETGGAS